MKISILILISVVSTLVVIALMARKRNINRTPDNLELKNKIRRLTQTNEFRALSGTPQFNSLILTPEFMGLGMLFGRNFILDRLNL